MKSFVYQIIEVVNCVYIFRTFKQKDFSQLDQMHPVHSELKKEFKATMMKSEEW